MNISWWALIGLASNLPKGVATHSLDQHVDSSQLLLGSLELDEVGEEHGFEIWRGNESEGEEALLDQVRVLQSTVGDFVEQSECVPSSCDTATAFSALTDKTEIGCGQCVYMDMGGIVNLNGLNIIGKLQFPAGHDDVTINTPYVVVQGELEILSNLAMPVSPDNKGVKFMLTGDTDSQITPYGANAEKCGGPCNIGKKSFIVAGGKLSITAIPFSCATWSKIVDLTASDRVMLQPGDFDEPIHAPDGCSDPLLYDETFENSFGHGILWTGGLGTSIHHQEGTNTGLVVTKRKITDQGPFADITSLKSCMLADVDYVFSARIKLSSRTIEETGQPTTCKLSDNNCLKLHTAYQKSDESKHEQQKATVVQASAPDYDTEFHFGATFRFTQEEIDEDNVYLVIYMSGPEAGIDIILEEFELSLPEIASYPDPHDACYDLTLGGDANLNGFATYPMRTNISPHKLIKVEESGNKFYRLTDRNGNWEGFHQTIASKCAQADIRYDFSARIRLHSEIKEQAYVEIDVRDENSDLIKDIQIVACPEQSYSDGWQTCSGTITFDGSLIDTPLLELNIKTRDSDVSDAFDMDIDDVQFHPAEGPLDTLVLDNTNNKISGCWGRGSEILFTSQTLEYDDDEVRTIVDVTTSSDGTLAIVKLDSAIFPVSVVNDDDPNAAVFAGEVALLTRNVIVEGDDTDSPNNGGYFMIYRTPDVKQTIEGVEFRKMGQQGIWDRYPIHFDQCKNAGNGSKVSMNTIRDSFQRCVVLEGTNSVMISKNVAFNTAGHCYVLEDRTEINNVFEHNIGARTNRILENFLVDAEKNDPSTFFCANPNNHWIGNVAAGSYDRGFYFALSSSTAGESSSLYNGSSPRNTEIGTFRDNIAHSNNRGLSISRLYQSSTITNFQSHRNYEGFHCYICRHFMIEGGVFADNRKQLYFDRSDDFQVSGSAVRGFTASYKNLLDKRILNGDSDTKKLCDSSTNIVGMKIPTKAEAQGKYGMSLVNVQFSDFDTAVEGGCSAESTLFNYDDSLSDMHFSFHSSFQGVMLNDSRPGLHFDKCHSRELREGKSVDDIVITDIDSSFNPDKSSTFNGASSIVSNEPYMTAFAKDSGAECMSPSESECVTYCKNLCLRTVDYFVEMEGTENWSLVVKKIDGTSSSSASIPGHEYLWYDGYYANRRRFSVPLPSGTYVAEFQNDMGAVVWPRYVQERWDLKPACTDYPSAEDVSLVKPHLLVDECDDLLLNGHMDESYEPWKHNGGKIEFDTTAGVNGSGAITTTKRTKTSHGLGQHLDTRCVEKHKGQQLEFSAQVKLVDSELKTVHCDPNQNSGSKQCPELDIKKYYEQDANKEQLESSWKENLAEGVRSYALGDFTLFHGLITLEDNWYSNGIAYFMYFDGKQPTDINIVLDEVSLTPFQSSCSSNIVLNGDFHTGSTKYWSTYYGTPFLKIIDGKNGPGDYALRIYNRGDSIYNSVKQDLQMGCLVEGERYIVQIEYKLEKNGSPFECDPSVEEDPLTRCLEFDIKSFDSQQHEHKTVAYTSSPFNVNGWNYVVGAFHATNKMITADEKVSAFFDRVDPSVDIIINDVSITPLPRDCNSLILNSDFEIGRGDHWRVTDNDHNKNDIVLGYNSAYAIRSYDRDDASHGLLQVLDQRCMVVHDEYIVNAMFKLEKEGVPVECDPSEFSDTEKTCPSVLIFGESCVTGNIYHRLYNELTLPWNSGTFNRFESTFIVDNALATCEQVIIKINKVNPDFDIIVDDFEIQHSRVINTPTEVPTVAPNHDNSPSSSPAVTSAPSPASSGAPTQVAIDCPGLDEEPKIIDHGDVLIGKTQRGVLCTLTKRTFVGGVATSIVPLARSYDNYDWETAAGEFAFNAFADQEWNCYPTACGINLPDLLAFEGIAEERYVLASYEYAIKKKDEVARLLESYTFGTRRAQLNSWNYTAPMDVSIAAWVEDQMSAPLTSHREFWRERSNQRVPTSFEIGMPDHPCDPLSTWRKYTFTQWDESRDDAMLNYLEVVPLNLSDGPFLLKINGHPRTVVDGIQFRNNAYSLNTEHIYEICNDPQTPSMKYPRGRLWLRTESGSCEEVDRSNANPLVDLTAASSHLAGIHIFQIPDTVELMPVNKHFSNNEEYILVDGLTDSLQEATCDAVGLVIENDDAPVFAQLSDGTWLQFDPRLRLEENTVDKPISDGGGSNYIISGEDTLCSNVPRTFLNKDNCILSTESTACGAIPPAENDIVLDQYNLLNIHNLTGRYVYEIQGLPVIDHLGDTITHPCTAGWRSRWEVTESVCSNPSPSNPDSQMVIALLGVFANNGDTNPYIRDITFPTSGVDCGSYDTYDVDIQIQNNAECWTHKHPEHRSVYDMTYWTRDDTHIGNGVAEGMGRPNPIKKFIDVDQSATLHFPAYHPTLGSTFNHDEARWEMNVAHFAHVGRFGDTIRFRDLPNELKQEAISDYYSTGDEQSGPGVVVCGSPGEVSNNPYSDDTFSVSVHINWDVESSSSLLRQKHAVWTMIALTANDQLRQRMAYALSQILVIVTSSIDSSDRSTEMFLQYYDIFVRNAFGNYRDVLKEISYSPLMAENLSFLKSKSHAYVMDKYSQNSFADENFAREIMQLFSTGLYLLNLDGTLKLDGNGSPINAYSNAHILSFARGWTGFDRQRKRGNIEERQRSENKIDPMKIWADWRDRFPKIDMQNGFIGDHYPLCEDFPDKMFLKKRATFRLLGSSSLPELIEDDEEFDKDQTIKRFTLNTTSDLYSALCREESGKCQFAAEVVLDSTYDCHDQECYVDTLRVVEVIPGIYYEYVRPPCVELPFFNNARKLSRKRKSLPGSICGNPRLPTASEACCPLPLTVGTQYAERNPIYDGERMTYATAEQRCLIIDGTLCDYDVIEISDNYKTGYHWTPGTCEIRVKINSDGYVAIVYDMQTPADKVSWIDDKSQNFFEVRWDGDIFPNPSNNCGEGLQGKCEVLQKGGCLCQTSVFEEAVFDSMPTTKDAALSMLSIGALDPNTYATNEYTMELSAETGIAAYHSRNGFYDEHTIFELTDDYGRHFFLKNIRSTVEMKDLFGKNIDFSFRNPPNFMSLIPIEATVRDAQYETEAILDDYFYHPNTAPFLCIRFIQRFGISNPAPRYVKSCATAFQEGIYHAGGKSFGTGKYGCLNATVASIALDRETRSVVLDADPSQGSLREPLLKILSVMRNMEFKREDHVRQVVLMGLDDRIGQMAHEFATVFSFFLPEYAPDGVITTATLVAPEAELLDMPKTVSLLNGLFSMIKFGLANCYDGFGENVGSGGCRDNGSYQRASGILEFEPSSTLSTDIIDELATLMTAGRLSERNREIIREAFESAENQEAGLRIAQQLIVTTPEFQTTNPIKFSGVDRELPEKITPSDRPYKAVVFLMFGGGCDSFNMLTPYTCAPEEGKDDLFEQYLEVRQSVALQKHTLHQIPANNQVCDVFGIHPNLPVLAELYNEGSALFFANTGVLDDYADETNYKVKSVTNLFAHNTMQRATKRLDPYKEIRGTGVLGRMNDVLTRNGFKTSTISTDSASIALVGQPGVSPDPSIISKNGVDEFNPESSDQKMSQEDMFLNIRALNNSTQADSGFFGETWSSKLIKSLVKNSELYSILEATQTNIMFPTSELGSQLEVVARMMKAHTERGVDRDMFYVKIGGFDTHADVEGKLADKFEEVNLAIGAFAEELKLNLLWDDTTLVQQSDFARTLVPNGGEGTDHAWGGNYFMMGGSVDGMRILGHYPEHFTEGAPNMLGRGRMVPTTSWDMVWNGIAEWFGVTGEDLNEVCPNRDSFSTNDLFTSDELYK